MAFIPVIDKPGEPTIYLGTEEDLAMTDTEINAVLPGAAIGTILATAAYKAMKQLGPDGSWVSFDEGS